MLSNNNMAAVARLPALHELLLGGCAVTNASLRHITSLHLTRLECRWCPPANCVKGELHVRCPVTIVPTRYTFVDTQNAFASGMCARSGACKHMPRFFSS